MLVQTRASLGCSTGTTLHRSRRRSSLHEHQPRRAQSQLPFPPPSASDGGGPGGRSTTDKSIGTAECASQREQWRRCMLRAFELGRHALQPCTESLAARALRRPLLLQILVPMPPS